MNRNLRLLIPALALGVANLVCTGRVFTQLHVYSATPAPIEQLYDTTTDTILHDDVWVFRSDGTFDAVLIINGERLLLSGTYNGDDAGDEFIFGLDIDDDGQDDELIYADVTDDSFSLIEWRRDDGTFIYRLIE
jgi:hypothetical protein